MSKETYPDISSPERPGALLLVLDQYRQSIITGEPLPVEWLAASVEAGVLLPVADFIKDVRDAEVALAAAEAVAQAERDKPEVIGEDEPAPEDQEAQPLDAGDLPIPKQAKKRAS